MMYTNNRDAYRQAFFHAWAKYKKGLALETFEKELIAVILLHPEYQSILENPKQYESQEFSLEENPFFHLSLHLSIREQLRTNRPSGINDIYQQLLQQFCEKEAEHHMMDCLAQTLWEAQRTNGIPDEEAYLQKLREITR